MMPTGGFAVIDALGRVLLHFLWQGAAIGLLYSLLRPFCTSASARYRLGLGMLAVLALCPLITLAWLWPAAGSAAAADGSGSVAAVAAQTLPHWQVRAVLPWLVALWLCGVFGMAARSLWQWRNLQVLVRGASRPGAAWELRLAYLRARFGVGRPVRLLSSARVVTPMLVGWIKPAILLPASLLSGFPPQQVELIIAHELGHIRRWDYLANLAQVIVETVLFYHPVVHWISRDVRNAREECCDDLVLRVASGKALAYARALAGLEQLRHDLGFAAPALGAGGGELLARIRRIVGVGAMAQPAPRNLLLPLLAVAALTCMVWRMQHRDADIGAAMIELPAQTLALVSGNPHLVPPQDLSVTLPVAEIMPLSAVAAGQLEAPADVRIVRPHAVLAAAALGGVRNLAPDRALVSLRAPEFADDVPAEPMSEAAPLRMVPPVYPSRAMAAGIEGSVELSYRIAADGGVGQMRVLHAQPAGVFDEAARAALAAWRFPASAAGQTRTQNFAFTLHGKTASDDRCQSQTGTMICRKPGD